LGREDLNVEIHLAWNFFFPEGELTPLAISIKIDKKSSIMEQHGH
jgi:hypothetical protein